MLREPNHRELMLAQMLPVLDDFEQASLSLPAQSAGSRKMLFSRMGEDTQKLRLACSAVPDLSELVPVLTELEELLASLESGDVAFTDRIEAALRSTAGAIRQSFSSNVKSAAASQVMSKILQNLARVLAGLRGRVRAVPHPNNDLDLDAYAAEFLRDPTSIVPTISVLSAKLSANPLDADLRAELFRHVHTLKGNAMAFGFEALARLAEAYEDLLCHLQNADLAQNPGLARFVEGGGVEIARVFETYRMGRVESIDVESFVTQRGSRTSWIQAEKPASAPVRATNEPVSQPKRVTHYLSVCIAGRSFLISCAALVEVSRRPRLMKVPGGTSNWLGVFRARGLLVPVVDPCSFIGEGVARSQFESLEFAVVIASLQVGGIEARYFAVPIDDVGEVIELPFGELPREPIVLEIEAVLKSAG